MLIYIPFSLWKILLSPLMGTSYLQVSQCFWFSVILITDRSLRATPLRLQSSSYTQWVYLHSWSSTMIYDKVTYWKRTKLFEKIYFSCWCSMLPLKTCILVKLIINICLIIWTWLAYKTENGYFMKTGCLIVTFYCILCHTWLLVW